MGQRFRKEASVTLTNILHNNHLINKSRYDILSPKYLYDSWPGMYCYRIYDYNFHSLMQYVLVYSRAVHMVWGRGISGSILEINTFVIFLCQICIFITTLLKSWKHYELSPPVCSSCCFLISPWTESNQFR